MAQDVIMLARALRLERYAVLGHSFGASVALQNAVDYPGMAAAAILSNRVPSGRWRVAVERNLELFGPAELREKLVRSWARESSVSTQEECAELLSDQLPFYFADPIDPRIDDYRSRIGDTVYSPEMFRASSAGVGLKVELEDRLGEVAAPTLVLSGRYDRACAPEASDAMARAIGGSELHVFERSGHMPFVEEQAGYLEVVRGFLERKLQPGSRSVSR
jgi:Predicted hydrolases or acyltransferases (alpha/beta hydrolase superfamily)